MRDRFRSQVLMLFWALLGVCGLCGVCGVCEEAGAQTTAEVNAGVQFNFSTPGARSLGLGGAFLGLADDATAAYANPAGLTVLSEPEVSFEVRNWDFLNTYVQGGRLVGSPTGRGIDTVPGLAEGEDGETVTGVSYLSAVYPGRSWAVAVYRHGLADYQARFRTDGVFARETDRRTRPKDNAFHLEVTGVGLSGAVRLGERLSLGAGIVSYDFSMLSRTDRYEISAPTAPNANEPGGFYGPSLYTPGNLVDTQIQSGDDRQTGFNAGFRYKVAPGWTLGGVYRQGPEFDLDAIYLRGPRGGTGPRRETLPAHYDLPDVLGAGLAYQPTEFLTFTLDYVHVEYSELTRGIVNILLLQRETGLGSEARFFKVDDAGEIHLGFESVFPVGRSLLAARAGTWYDPDHRIRYEGELPGFQAAFRSGEDETHFAAGFGLIVPHLKFQADLAFDYSDPVKTASLSTVVRF